LDAEAVARDDGGLVAEAIAFEQRKIGQYKDLASIFI
jgi:hypothetical protein